MNGRLIYTHQVVGNAVDELALGVGPIRERLRAVYVELLHVLEDDVPEDLRDDYKFIVDAFTDGQPRLDAEGLRARLEQMSDEQAVQVGRRLRQFEDRFNIHLREHEKKQLRARKRS